MTHKTQLEEARRISWENLGKQITFYIPGMFFCNGVKGKYPGISITGNQCSLSCDHCGGLILETMIPTETPEELLKKCIQLEKKGNYGVLLSGGCMKDGKLPWQKFIPAISEIKRKTDLFISIHAGLIDYRDAAALKTAGVDQALIDVVGNDETYQKVYHVPFGVVEIQKAMEALQKADLPTVPHVVCGLDYGRITGEKQALEMISQFPVDQVVIVSLMNLTGTKMEKANPPDAHDVAHIIATARTLMPKTSISLGCARQRGNVLMETLAIDAGINRMALPSEEAISRAKFHGLEIRYQKTCCSVTKNFADGGWNY
ncbi:MAG: radical SAM protein [Deltaproteobacteria bacterium]|nr:radical SAM protein [Deltaproteobacteria bacterium]